MQFLKMEHVGGPPQQNKQMLDTCWARKTWKSSTFGADIEIKSLRNSTGGMFSDSFNIFLNKCFFLVNPIPILNPAFKILSRDGRIRAIRRPRSMARSRERSWVVGSEKGGGCYIFQISQKLKPRSFSPNIKIPGARTHLILFAIP